MPRKKTLTHAAPWIWPRSPGKGLVFHSMVEGAGNGGLVPRHTTAVEPDSVMRCEPAPVCVSTRYQWYCYRSMILHG